MKAFRRSLCLFAAAAALLSVFRTPAARAVSWKQNERFGYFAANRFVESMTLEERKAAEKNGVIPVTPWEYVVSRLGTFAEIFDCNIMLGLWTDMEDAAFDGTFEEFLDYLTESEAALTADDAVAVVYVQDLDRSYIHIGRDAAVNCDTSAVEAALRDPDETDHFFKATKVIETLAQALRGAGAEGRYLLKCDTPDHQEQITRALAPLREKFPGYVRVQYLDYTTEPRETVVEWMQQVYEENLTYCMADGIYIAYCRNTGAALVRVGERTGLTLKDAAGVEAAFHPAEGSEDHSGFAAGVIALSDALTEDAGVSPVLVVSAIVVVLAAAGALALVLVRRKKAWESR